MHGRQIAVLMSIWHSSWLHKSHQDLSGTSNQAATPSNVQAHHHNHIQCHPINKSFDWGITCTEAKGLHLVQVMDLDEAWPPLDKAQCGEPPWVEPVTRLAVRVATRRLPPAHLPWSLHVPRYTNQ